MSALDHTGDSFRWELGHILAGAPPNFNFEALERWMDWKKAYQRYHSLVGLTKATDEVQIRILLHVMGVGVDYWFARLDESDKKKYDTVMKGFDKLFAPWSNRAQHIEQFNRWMQGDNESNEHYIRGLVELAAKCDFGKERANHIKHRLLTGMKDTALSAELIQQCPDDDLTLETVTSQMIEKELVQTKLQQTGSTAIDLTVDLPGYGSAPQRNTMPAGYNMNPDDLIPAGPYRQGNAHMRLGAQVQPSADVSIRYAYNNQQPRVAAGPGNMMGGIAMAGQQRNMMMPSGSVTYQQQQQPMRVMPPQQMMGPPQQLMMGINQPGSFVNNSYMQQDIIPPMANCWLNQQ